MRRITPDDAADMWAAWFDDAACVGRARLMDPPLDARDDDALAEAMAVCLGCTVRADCARWVLDLPDMTAPGWVVGGMTETQIGKLRAAEGKISDGYRLCTGCQQVLPLEDFHTARTRTGKLQHRPTCIECRRVDQRRRYYAQRGA